MTALVANDNKAAKRIAYVHAVAYAIAERAKGDAEANGVPVRRLEPLLLKRLESQHTAHD